MALVDFVRGCLDITSNKRDDEISMWIDAAFADMERCGVNPSLLDRAKPGPIVKAAVVEYVKAHQGYDNTEADRFERNYTSRLAALLNSKANTYLFAEEP